MVDVIFTEGLLLHCRKKDKIKVEMKTIREGNASAAWQTWRFQVDKSTGEATATVEVFLKEEGGAFVSQGTFTCGYRLTSSPGCIGWQQNGATSDNMVSHLDYIKVGTGLGEFGKVIPLI